MRPTVTPCRNPAVAALVVVGFSFSLAAQAAEGQTRARRVAVFDFDYSAVRTATAELFGTDIDVGRGITDMLVTALVNDGTYSVIERSMLDPLLDEQDFSNSSRVDASSAAQIGRVLGLDAIIMGRVTQFGSGTGSTALGGVGGAVRRFGFGGFSQSETRAIVAIDARVVNVETAEILTAAQGHGESSRRNTTILGTEESFGAGGISFGSSDFQETILGEAVRLATEQVAAGLVADADRIELRRVVVEGLVAAVDNGLVILNVGTDAGASVGDLMRIERVTREIRDPVTDAILRRLTAEIGTIELFDVDAVSSIGRITAGAEFQVGDVATTITN